MHGVGTGADYLSDLRDDLMPATRDIQSSIKAIMIMVIIDNNNINYDKPSLIQAT